MTDASLWWPASQLVGWTLVHFLWQGAFLGLVYVALRSALPRGAARYRLGMATLFALALCPLLTLWTLLGRIPDAIATGPATALAAIAAPGAVVDVAGATSAFDALLPWLVLAWSLGVALHLLQAWRQWRALKALVRVAESVPRWQRRAVRMAQRFGLRRRVTVLASRMVTTPMLIGWLRPVILLPMAVVCGFPASQIELILAHELAHLRRWDPLANLFQLALETLYFYHPVVRWISRDVSNEREICCDQLALALGGGDRREFVTVLAELGELRERQNSFSLAANGGTLLDRVQLMMLPSQQVAQARKGAHVVALALAAALVVLTLRLQWVKAQIEVRMDSTVTRLQTLLLPVPLPAPATLATIRLEALPMLPLHLAGTAAAASKSGTGSPPLRADTLSSVLLPQASSVPMVAPVLMPAWRVPPTATSRIAPPAVAATPMPIYVRQPIYPHTALRQGIEGQVVVEFSLAEDGSVRGLRAISANPIGIFEQSALDAVRDWKYAVPAGAVGSERYRQSVAFILGRPRADGRARSLTRDVRAGSDCRVVTGTHICRWLDDAAVPVPVLRPSSTRFR